MKLVAIKTNNMILDSLLRLFGLYDSNGLKYSKSHLRDMKFLIIDWDIEYQAKYVDQAIKLNVNHPSTARSVFSLDPTIWFIREFNTTSVGNLAYIALNNKQRMVRERAKECLLCLREYFNSPLVGRGKY